MNKSLYLQLLILFCFTFCNSTRMIAQSTESDSEKELVKTHLDQSLKYNQKGKIDSSLIEYNKAIRIKESIESKTRHDSTSIGVLYSLTANITDYLGEKDNVINSLSSSYYYFSNVSEPKTEGDKVNQISTLKSLLYHLLDQNLQETTIFEPLLLEFESHIEDFKNDKIQYNGYTQYLNSIKKIQSTGFSKLDKAVFDAERHSMHSQMLQNDSLKYLSQKSYLKHIRAYRNLSSKKEHRTINTHLVTLLGNLSYYSLFQSDFEFSEKCAQEAIGLKMNQWWIATNLIHAVYLQGRLDKAKDLFYLYKDIKNNDGKTLGTLIKQDIIELELKGICDSSYMSFVNRLEKEISIEFSSQIIPKIPVLCIESGEVETSSTVNYDSYKWIHNASNEIKSGKSVLLDKKGIWTLITIDSAHNEIQQKIYVDTPDDLTYTEVYLRQSDFVPIQIFIDKNSTDKTPSIAFTKDSDDFINIDTVAKHVLTTFKIIKDKNGKSISISNNDLCGNWLENYYSDFKNLEVGLFLIQIIDPTTSRGTIYLKAKDPFEDYPIVEKELKFNQLFHLQNKLPKIIQFNKTSFEIARVLLSNIFMGRPFSGW